MSSSIVSPQSKASTTAKPWRPGLVSRIFALTPLWVLLAVPIVSPTYFDPMFGEYPTILGINLGLVVTAVALGWMLIGLGILWNAKTLPVEALVYAVFTIPATMMVIFTPALVLILLNTG